MSAASSGAVLVERITTPVREMHRSISSSWFRRIGPVAAPVGLAHDSISDVAYGSILLAAAVLGPLVDDATEISTPTAVRLRSLVNSLWGDDLGRHHDRVAIPMSAHDRRGPGAASNRLVVLVHGLSDSEACWSGDAGLLAAIDERPDLTPVTIRYNAGLPIAANGALLANLLDDVVTGWPVPVESISLVGYSMGALVTHHALAAGHTSGHAWAAEVADVVAIGGPHTGSPIERTVGAASRALAATSVTRPLADFLDSRSGGIKDLGDGSVVPDCDWSGLDTRFHFIAGAVTADPRHPVGAVAGDLVVTPASGLTPTHLEPTSSVSIGGTHHLGLLQHPGVISRTMRWITPVD